MRKYSKLYSIQKDAQRVANAISSSLELETEIVDETLTIVAGTGRYRDMVGFKEEGGDPQAGYIYGRVVTQGKAEIVEDAPNDPKYDPSVRNGTTAELAEICFPIIAQGKVLGVIGLVAFSETQRNLLLKRKDGMIEFRSEDGLQLTLPEANEIDIDTIEGVSVHPEVIGIALDASEVKSLESDGCTTFPGRIKDIFYQGDFSELTITLEDVQRELSIHMARGISHDKELCAGLDIIVYWKRAHNNILTS